MSFNSLLNTTCKVLRSTPVRNATTGQMLPTFLTVYLAIPCRLDQAQAGRENVGATKKLETWTHVLFMPTGYTVKMYDRVYCKGTTFTVVNVADAGGHGHHIELGLVYVE